MPRLDYDTEQRLRLLVDEFQSRLTRLFFNWWIATLEEQAFLIRNSAGELEINHSKNAMYTIKTVTTVTNEDTSKVEHEVTVVVAGCSAKEITQMQRPLIDVQTKWNDVGTEGEEK